jgi:uncharacterized protein (DUF2236 family)
MPVEQPADRSGGGSGDHGDHGDHDELGSLADLADLADLVELVDQFEALADDSVMRRVYSEACIFGGAGRAILLQVAHPMVGRGVAEHSRFADDPLARLRGTMNYVYGVTFGTREEAEWIAAHVGRVHRRVVGPGYSAGDPELQRWVAATLYDSARQIYQLVCGPMSTADKEALCRDVRRMATALGCPADLWPATVAEFDEYWAGQVETLAVGDDARRIFQDLMYNRTLPWYLKALQPTNRLVTAGLLPPAVRDAYGLPWNRRRAGVFRVVIGTTRVTYRFVPGAVRRLPMTHYLRGFREKYATTRARQPARGTDPR